LFFFGGWFKIGGGIEEGSQTPEHAGGCARIPSQKAFGLTITKIITQSGIFSPRWGREIESGRMQPDAASLGNFSKGT